MDRTARILSLALLTLCSLAAAGTASAAAPASVEDLLVQQPGLRLPAGAVRSFASPLRWQLVGDYYFAPSLGLRATGGLQAGVTGSSDVRLGTTRQRATPYVGLGYSTGGVSANRWGGWGLSADIGVQARGSDLTLGRALESPAGVGELIRELRLTPVLQLGVSYAF
ncbi:hypothetical protein HZU83_15345 [Sphaerotilus montanus]|jgi:hypothetical protein|uniref:Outer membrane protein beta-barrel domain-containing protein n=1 Tax=Sphaerotilus montanus TaxID=522889 RepID=A0A7Y9QUW2_9BURK|nr:hypothetical protein [Sphaerotilus montanus]NYG31795.1 hypothetical protein [Sphaerotilus montanus]NZD58069.1 hypothetical protein [Sphaerotilus montanus]